MTLERILTKIKKGIFILNLQRIKNEKFYIFSQNCTGSIFYKLLNKEYLTPTIDLFFYAPCFVEMVSNFEYYINLELKEVKTSKYKEGNENLIRNSFYPIGMLGDLEIHFLHYKDWKEVQDKWNRRKKRLDFNKIIFLMTDKDLCSETEINKFLAIEHINKLFLTCRKEYLDRKDVVYLPFYAGKSEVGNIFKNYHSLLLKLDITKLVRNEKI